MQVPVYQSFRLKLGLSNKNNCYKKYILESMTDSHQERFKFHELIKLLMLTPFGCCWGTFCCSGSSPGCPGRWRLAAVRRGHTVNEDVIPSPLPSSGSPVVGWYFWQSGWPSPAKLPAKCPRQDLVREDRIFKAVVMLVVAAVIFDDYINPTRNSDYVNWFQFAGERGQVHRCRVLGVNQSQRRHKLLGHILENVPVTAIPTGKVGL